MSPALIMGLVLCAAAFVLVAVVLLQPRRAAAAPAGPGLAARTLGATERALQDAGWYGRFGERLELAGIRMRPASVVTLVTLVTVAAVILGAVLGIVRGLPWGLAFPVVFGALALVAARAVIARTVARRRAAFAEQLDDTLQLIASGLRAGLSLPAALDAVAAEAESPTAEEFARLLNKNRIGYDLAQAIEECAERMDSDDLAWTAQAVAIHREVGGNLGEVLDHVGETIRERNQIRRQIRTLSAEGRISANVLIALPIGIALVLAVISPDYISLFVTTPVGMVLIGISLVLFTVGVLWLRAITRIRF
ncbi:MAG TPA: type II secretion system F family protein [Pseudolysinimonas sp.]|nr:type II secretion system F family protein [Pseudolysinimonas sp.]